MRWAVFCILSRFLIIESPVQSDFHTDLQTKIQSTRWTISFTSGPNVPRLLPEPKIHLEVTKFLTVKVWRRVWACYSLLSVINVTWMKTLYRRFRAAGLKFLRFRFMWRQRTRPPTGAKENCVTARSDVCLLRPCKNSPSEWFVSDGRTDVQEKCHTRSYFSIYWTESVFFFLFRWHTWCVRVLWVPSISSGTPATNKRKRAEDVQRC